MGVGGVRGGGRSGGPKGPRGAAKSGRAAFGGVGKSESLVRASRAAGSVEAADPVTAGAIAIAKGLKNGTISSQAEATQQLVALILEHKHLLHKNGKAAQKLVERIADTLQDDPRLAAALERTWSRQG